MGPGADRGARGKERVKRKIANNKIKREKVAKNQTIVKIYKIKQSRHSKVKATGWKGNVGKGQLRRG